MKVKNIVFSGFMAMVLAGACGAANAEIIVASQKYVDTKLGSVNTELSGKITALETANATGGAVANAIAEAKQAGTNAQGAVDALAEKMDLTSEGSDLSQALATKEDTANKITTTDATYFTNGKMAEGALTEMASDNTNFPTIATAVEIADAKAQDVLTKVNANAGNLSTITANVEKLMGADTVAGSVAYQVKQEETRAMAAEAQVLADAKDYADGLATNYDVAGSAAGALNDAKTYTNEKVEALDGQTGTEAADGSYVVQTTEADGVVTVSRQAFDSTISTADNAVHSSVTAPTTAAVASYVADQMMTVTTQANSVQEQLDRIYKKDGEVESGILPTIQSGLQGQIDAIKNADTGVLAQANDYTDTEVSGLETKLMNETNGTVTAAIKAEADRAKAAEAQALTDAKAYTNTEMEKFYANAETCVTSSESNNCIMSAKLDAENKVQYVWISLTNPAE